jgi:hypothetical protein
LIADDVRALAEDLRSLFFWQLHAELQGPAEDASAEDAASAEERAAALAASHVTVCDAPGAVHDWVLLPWFDVRRGDAARAMDGMAAMVCEACGEYVGCEPPA